MLKVLQEEKASRYAGGIYHKTQIELTYNSNHMEGSRLTHEQTRYIFETNTIGVENEVLNVDDVIETANHFRCIDLLIDKAKTALSEKLIKELHFILKTGTSDARKDWLLSVIIKSFRTRLAAEIQLCRKRLASRCEHFWQNIMRKRVRRLKIFWISMYVLKGFIRFKMVMDALAG